MRTATFALFLGIAYLSTGLLGLVPEALRPPATDAPPVHVDLLYGYLLGLFPVNVLQSVLRLAIGAWGITAWHGVTSPRMFARGLAVLYGVLAVMGLIPEANTFFGILPVYGHNVWLHAGTAAAAAYFGWRTEVVVERRADVAGDRRERVMLVSHNRRHGHSDRRQPFSEV